MIVTYKDLKTRVCGYIVIKYTEVRGTTQGYIYQLFDPDTHKRACEYYFNSVKEAKEYAKVCLPRK